MFNIKINSKEVVKGDTFVAIKGYNVDGHDYIEDAIENGASKIIAEYGKYDVETILVPDTSVYIEKYLVDNYKNLLDKINFIGVTGTNGKTSTAFIIYQMLNELNIKCAYIGTIGYYDGKFIKKLNNTTPNIVELYDLIVTSYEKGITHIVMEVSSHSLDLNRISGINFCISGFTNLTQDHLDYHKTMENYLESKKKILNISNKIIVNADDKYGSEFCKNNYETIGFKNADYKINAYESRNNKTLINFSYGDNNYLVETNFLGKFNVYNYILGLSICSNFKSIDEIITISNKIFPPNGRCDMIVSQNFKVVIDYAHTPDAVEKIIKTFREDCLGRIITVIGCGGNRDPLKRPIMGKIANSLSDFCIFTSDNPRFEDANYIINDILKGVINKEYEIVIDRKSAIKRSLLLAKENDVVLILGKGHEDYQIIGNKKYYLSDKQEVLESNIRF